MHEEAYNNNVTKIKHAMNKLGDVKEKIVKYDAELKMSRAEAEMAKLATSFDFNVTTDFGQIEEVIQDKIGLNRAKARVAADLSSEGLVDIQREQAMEKVDGRSGPPRLRSADGAGHARDRESDRSDQGTGTGGQDEGYRRLSSRISLTSLTRFHGSIERSHRRSEIIRVGATARTAARLVSGLGGRIGESLFLGHDLRVRAARQRARFGASCRMTARAATAA